MDAKKIAVLKDAAASLLISHVHHYANAIVPESVWMLREHFDQMIGTNDQMIGFHFDQMMEHYDQMIGFHLFFSKI